VPLDQLEKVTGDLKVYSPAGLPAVMEIGMRPDDVYGWTQYFMKMDQQGVGMFVHAHQLELVCAGASIARGFQGGVVLSGKFTLVGVLFKGEPPQTIELGRHLLVTAAPGDVATGHPAGIIKPFKVKCSLVCSADDLAKLPNSHGSLKAPWEDTTRSRAASQKSSSSFFTSFRRNKDSLPKHLSSVPY
jgi:hypothetical protein